MVDDVTTRVIQRLSHPHRPPERREGGAAGHFLSLAEGALGGSLPLRVTAWDGTVAGAADAAARVTVRSPRALRRVLYAPNEIGLGRAYVTGEIDVDGDLAGTLDALADAVESWHRKITLAEGIRLLSDAARLGVIGPRPKPPATEVKLSGRPHSRARDAAAISHHYDVPTDFYRLFLGDTMAYSCGYWPDGVDDLDAAQRAKFDLVCRKLDLQPGMRILDIGCGWGGFVEHAAREYGVDAVGVTISGSQVQAARDRIHAAGLTDRVTIRRQDYREIGDGPYDAIVSIGMAEHVGTSQLPTYTARLFDLLGSQGRLLHHAIAARAGTRPQRATFIRRFIFPDGELQPVAAAVQALEDEGFEVRDVHALREHYVRTLRTWLDGLERNWDQAVRLVGLTRARTWRIYLAGSSVGFAHQRVGVNQILAVRPDRHGGSGMPASRVV
ncbi:MAG TPA: cyclopropane-fatty-acyl-phospholipid synthase family protein [Mycobacteriales bacterium]|jgi:cyclopropane-fatty-acyl-phospholipid synthase